MPEWLESLPKKIGKGTFYKHNCYISLNIQVCNISGNVRMSTLKIDIWSSSKCPFKFGSLKSWRVIVRYPNIYSESALKGRHKKA